MTTTIDPWAERVDGGDWEPYHRGAQRARGALLPRLVTPEEAARIAGLYEQDEHFRSTVNMGRHRFGEGEYRYFARPFPEPIEQLRQALYPHLLPIARDWWDKLGRPAPGTTMTMATDPAGPQRAERAFMSAQRLLAAPGAEVAAGPGHEGQRRRRG